MVGQQISHYRILEKLGEGGMGVVYKAQDQRLNRPVAIKILNINLKTKEKDSLRFIHEARAASALNHPNICTIHDIGEEQDKKYIVMEFIEGETLQKILERRGSLPEKEVIDLTIQICDALAPVHSNGIIHRDIKPDNIIITGKKNIKIMDFGLAKVISDKTEDIYQKNSIEVNYHDLEPSSLKTTIGSLIGTVTYMSPEQATGKKVDHRSDIFSLGIVLFELLTGKLPFEAETKIDVISKIIHEEIPYMTANDKQVSSKMVQVVDRMLKKNPDERYNDVQELSIELNNIKLGQKRKLIFRYPFLSLILFILLSILIYLPFKSLLFKSYLKENIRSYSTTPIAVS